VRALEGQLTRFDGTEHVVREECNCLRYTRSYVRAIHLDHFVEDFEPDRVKVLARMNLLHGLPPRGTHRNKFLATAMALLVSKGAYKCALELLGHENPKPSSMKVTYDGHCGVTLKSVIGHLALLGVTPELASQWDDYIYDWYAEYLELPNHHPKDDILIAMLERDKPPQDGKYTVLECLSGQRFPEFKDELIDKTNYHFPARGQRGHGKYEEIEDHSDLMPGLPFGMRPSREAPPPYDSETMMDQS